MNASKQLLVDWLPFHVSPQQINESASKNSGRLIVQGVIQRSDVKNANGRIYPKKVLEKQIDLYKKVYIKENRAMGELDHTDSAIVELKNTSHNILGIEWNGNEVVGTIEILPTPVGEILKKLFECGINVGISSRGLGSVKELQNDTVEVEDDYEIICWDFVSNPSTKGAFMYKTTLRENKQFGEEDKIDSILRELLCELNDICCSQQIQSQ